MTPAAVLAFPEIDPLDRLAATANAAHVEGCAEIIRLAITAGQALIEAKKLVGHGGWSRWVAENCVFSERTAQVYMKVARNPQRAADSLRDALRQAFNSNEAEKKRADKAQALLDVLAQRPDALATLDLRVCGCLELFATGIRPVAVVTEPPGASGYLSAFSELSYACREVPLVAVKVTRAATPFLPEVMNRLCEHLRFWDIDIHNHPFLILKFCQEPGALREQTPTRMMLDSSALHPISRSGTRFTSSASRRREHWSVIRS